VPQKPESGIRPILQIIKGKNFSGSLIEVFHLKIVLYPIEGFKMRVKCTAFFWLILFLLGLSFSGAAADEGKTIQTRLAGLGFGVSKMVKGKGGVYTVTVNRFTAKSPAISLQGPFRTFSMNAKVVRGKVYLDLAALRKNKYRIKKRNPGEDLVFIFSFRQYLTKLNDGLSRLKLILNAAYRTKEQMQKKINEANRKERRALDLIDDCRVSSDSLPRVRRAFSRLGVKTGRIMRNKKGVLYVQVAGLESASRLKLKARRPQSTIRVRLKNDRIHINRIDWNKVFSGNPAGEGFQWEASVTEYTYDTFGQTLPRFAVPFCSRGPTGFITRDCDSYINDAADILKNIRADLKCLEDGIGVIDRIINCVKERCRDGAALKEDEKTKLKKNLSDLKNFIERFKERSDRLIAQIERSIQRYNLCLFDESLAAALSR
jgi:hypothetical protein